MIEHCWPAQRSNSKWVIEVMAGALVAMKEAENPEPINPAYLKINYKRLCQAIENYPGGWREVVKVAGYNPNIEKSPRSR